MPTDRFPSSRPRPGGPRPGGDRPSYSSSDRPSYAGDRSANDRPNFSAGPRSFTPRPPAPVAEPPTSHSIRVRDGDREVEVSGSPAFVRQAIDDLPDLLARLRGERKGSPPGGAQPPPARSIAMPAPSPHGSPDLTAAPVSNGTAIPNGGPVESVLPSGPVAATGTTPSGPRAKRHAVAHSLEEQVIGILAGQKRPVTVAAIRKRLSDDVSGQQVRRTLERSDRVTATADRPAAYRLR